MITVFYYVGDMQRAVQMYRAILGFPPHKEEAYPEWVEFPMGNARFALHLDEALGECAEVATVRYGAIVSFPVQDIQAAAERAQAAGFRIVQAPWQEPFGWLATFQDPWGNVFHFHQLSDLRS